MTVKYSLRFLDVVTFLPVSLFLIVYNIIRIINVPVTHDEVLLSAAGNTYADIVNMKVVNSNNHILSSVIRKFFVEALSNSQFSLRLGSLFALFIYLLFSYLLCKMLFQSIKWQFAGFLLLNLHPLLFDFWGLSRGYSLGIAFMAGSIFFILSYQRCKKTGILWLSFLFAICSVYSNFAMLNFYDGLAAIIIANRILFRQPTGWKTFFIHELPVLTISSLLLYAMIRVPLGKLIAANELYYGGTENIISDTLYSVVKENIYSMHPQAVYIWAVCIAITGTALVSGIYWIYICIKRKPSERERISVLLYCLYIIPLAGIVVQHIIFGTKYLIDRTAIFFIVLFFLQFLSWLYCMDKTFFSRMVLLLSTLLVVVNFCMGINVRTTKMWEYDAYNVLMLQKIMREKGNVKNKIFVFWLFTPAVSYYINKDYSDHFYDVKSIGMGIAPADSMCTYYYVPANQVQEVPPAYKIDTVFGSAKGYYLLKK